MTARGLMRQDGIAKIEEDVIYNGPILDEFGGFRCTELDERIQGFDQGLGTRFDFKDLLQQKKMSGRVERHLL